MKIISVVLSRLLIHFRHWEEMGKTQRPHTNKFGNIDTLCACETFFWKFKIDFLLFVVCTMYINKHQEKKNEYDRCTVYALQFVELNSFDSITYDTAPFYTSMYSISSQLFLFDCTCHGLFVMLTDLECAIYWFVTWNWWRCINFGYNFIHMNEKFINYMFVLMCFLSIAHVFASSVKSS